MKKMHAYIMMGITLVILVVMLLLLSPWLNIKTINITGLNRVQEQDVLTMLNLGEDTNILSFSTFVAKKKLKANHYIDNIKVIKTFPNEVEIHITERDIIGYIPYINDFLYIDGDGRVIEAQAIYKEKLPIIYGIDIQSFNVGQVLNSEKSMNDERLLTVIEIANAVYKKDLSKTVLNIDVSNIDDIILYVGNIKVVMGDKERINVKINTLDEILKKFSPEEKGTLYINDITTDPIFKYIS